MGMLNLSFLSMKIKRCFSNGQQVTDSVLPLLRKGMP